MPIDPSIILGLKPAQITSPDPFEQAGKVMTLKALLKKQDDEQAVANAFRQSGGNPEIATKLLYGMGQPEAALKMQEASRKAAMDKSNIAMHESTTEFNKQRTANAAMEEMRRGLTRVKSREDAERWVGGLFTHPQIAEQMKKQGITLEQMIADLPTDANAIGQWAMQGAMSFKEMIDKQQAATRDATTAANQAFRPGPTGPIAQSNVQNFLMQKAAAPTLAAEPGRMERAQADLELRNRGLNDQIPTGEARPTPQLNVPPRAAVPGVVAPVAPQAAPSPSAFPKVIEPVQQGRNSEQIRILQAERDRNTNPSEIAEIDKELKRLGVDSSARGRANAAIKADVSVMGGRESTQINRILNSANQAAKDLGNVVLLPTSASRGIFGGRSQGKSLFEAGKETLATTMTTQEVQTYNIYATGFQRALAGIEAAGGFPTNALMHAMDAVIFKEGDTQFSKLQKLAQTRQIVEAGMEALLASPRLGDEQKKLSQKILDDIKKSVPFTQSELIRLQINQTSNPNTTLREVMETAKPASAVAPPKIGERKDGYIFKGGNPADPKSWEKE